MAEEVEAERLYVQIVADASGFRRDLRTKVTTAAKGIEASVRIKAKVDAKQLAVEARRAAREAADQASVKIKAEFSATQVRASLAKALSEGARARPVKARVEFEGTQVRAALQRALREGSRAGDTVRGKVDFSPTQTRDALQRALREGATRQAAKARVEFEPTQVKAALQRVLREGNQSGNAVLAKVEFSATQVRAALAKAIREGVQNKAVAARVEFNARQIRAALARALREASALQELRVKVAADITRFITQTEAARRAEERRAVTLRVHADTSSASAAIRAAGVALRTLSIGPAIASGILVLAGALANVTGGLFAFVSAASQAVGVLSVLPGLFAAAAQGVGTLLLGFSGISGALKAMTAADKQAGAASQNSARQQVNSAEQIRQAQERLADARAEAAQRVADAEREGAERISNAREQAAENIAAAEQRAAESITSAERARADAIRNVQRAEAALSKVRQQAREDIQQLAFSLREAVLSEEQAEINLEHAQRKVIQSRQSAVMSPLDKRQAELDYKQAILDLEEAKDRASDLGKENAKARREGVEGSEDVRDAKERLADANRDAREAELELTRARRDGAAEVAKARRDGAKAIADAESEAARNIARAKQEGAKQIKAAQEALATAMRSAAQQADTTSAAMNNLDYAMSRLGPAGQRFARFLHDTVIPALTRMRNAVQEALLPRMETAIRKAMPLLGTLQAGFVRTAKTIGDLAIRFGELAGSPAFRRDTATIMASNDRVLRSFGNAAYYLFKALTDVMVVAAPLTERFARLVERWAKGRAEAARTGRETGRMADFLERAWRTGSKLYHILGDLTAALHNVAKAALPAGNTMLDSLARAAERLREWTADPANQRRLQDFFDNTVPVMAEFAELLGKILKLFGRLGEVTGGHAMDGLFFVLDKFVEFLTMLTEVPGSGTILTTLLILAGAGFGLGVVARALGKIGVNLLRLSRLTGLSGALGLLFGKGRRGRSQVGDLADDVGRLTDEIDKELPKDKKKSDALDDVGETAGKASKSAAGAGGSIAVLGNKAEQSAKKTSRFARVLGGIKSAAGKVGKSLAGLGGLLLAGGSLRGLGAKISGQLKGILGKVKAPLGGAASKGAASAGVNAAKGGLLAGTVGAMLGKMPSLKGVLTSVRTWFAGLMAGIRGAVAKIFSKGALAGVAKGAAKGGAKGGAGGPIGIVGGILAGIIGQIIGGGHGGARGAVGGGITGGATGAAVGATIGSIFPVIGTAIGAALGGVIGVVVGAITGGKWWTKIAEFFGRTLPAKIVDGVKALPGALLSLLGKAAGLAGALITWAGGQLQDFGDWLLHKAADLLVALPALIIKALFAPFRLQAKLFAKSPDIFMWLWDQAAKLVPKLTKIFFDIPQKVFKALAYGFAHPGDVFGWLKRQADALGPRVQAAINRHTAALGALIGRMMDRAGRELIAQMGGLLRDLITGFSGWKRVAEDTGRSIWSTMQRWGTATRNTVGGWLSAIGRFFAGEWNRVRGTTRAAFDYVRSFIAGRMRATRDTVSGWLTSIRRTFSSARASVTGTVRGWFSDVTSWTRKHMGGTWSAISGILSKIRNGFRSARDYVVEAWRPMGRRLAGGVNWIGSNVYNRGIKWAWDKVADLVRKPHLPSYRAFAAGGTWGRVLPGYTPGRDVHRFTSPTGGVVDMSGGEAIMVPEWTQAVGTARVKVWNKLARRGGPAAVAAAMAQDFASPAGARRRAYSRGGIHPARPGRAPAGVPYQRFDIGGLFQGVKGFLGDLKDGFYGGLAKSVRKVIDPILNAVAANMGAGTWGNLLKAVPKQMTEPFLAWLTKVIEPKLGGDAKGVVKAAKSMIGQGDDRGPNNNWITRKWGMVGAPWCAMFVSEAISKAKAQKYYPGHPSAAVASYVNAMKHVGLGDGRPGDLAAYRGSGHINIIEKKSGGSYLTIGGNQNALVQRGVRGGQSSVLRPKFAAGGVFARNLIANAARLFKIEAPRQLDRHEMDTPLVAFMNRLSPDLISKVTSALVKTGTSIGPPIRRDTGGPLPPGGLAYNGLTRTEWVLTPEAVDFLGGERAVAALNSGAASLYRASRTITAPRAGSDGASALAPTVNVYPQPGQSETEIAAITARKLGVMLK